MHRNITSTCPTLPFDRRKQYNGFGRIAGSFDSFGGATLVDVAVVGDVVLVDDDDAAAAGFVDSLVCTGFLVILVDATSGGELLVKLVVRLVGATGNGDVTLTGTTLVASLVAGLVVAFFLLGLVDDDAAEFFGSLVGCFVGSLGGSLVGGGGFLSRFDDVDSFL